MSSDTPEILNPVEADQAHRILNLPEEGTVKLADVPPPVIVGGSRGIMTPDLTWFFLAPLYLPLSLNKDAVEMYAQFINTSFKVRELDLGNYVFTVDKVDKIPCPWYTYVQGLPPEFSSGFMDYISSFLFRSPKGATQVQWERVGIPDPFSTDRVLAATVRLWVPVLHNRTTKRKFGPTKTVGVLGFDIDA